MRQRKKAKPGSSVRPTFNKCMLCSTPKRSKYAKLSKYCGRCRKIIDKDFAERQKSITKNFEFNSNGEI